MVTKAKYSDKPTYEDLTKSLNAMKDHAIHNGVKAISMPQIGCGLDLLRWEFVKDIVESVFYDTEIQITVYIWEPPGKSAHSEQQRPRNQQRSQNDGHDKSKNAKYQRSEGVYKESRRNGNFNMGR